MTTIDSRFPVTGSEALKTTFRMHASGVAIITSSTDAKEPIGFTATSVTSLGSTPPLVSFNIARGSSSYEHLTPGKLVAIHTLCANNLELAQLMAGPKENRFQGDNFEWRNEVPIFPGASSVLLGRIRQRFEVESNAVVIVDALASTESNDDARPLLYYRRGYLTATERLAENS
jgi:flavin reductase (DIM6/NTAB) family NADH-FMN oxidoreductase RutF